MLDVFAIQYGVDGRIQDPAPFARSLAGFGDLARLVLSVSNSESFQALLPHLRLLNDGQILQNIPSRASDQIANKLFELYVACLAMRCGTNVTLDDPSRSDGSNPDVLCTFGGIRWGIACKVVHGASPQSLLDLIEGGLDQIDRSPASTGVVIVNLKNRIDHDFYWPPTTIDANGNRSSKGFRSLDEPLQGLTYDSQQIGAGLKAHATLQAIGAMFHGRKSIPAFALWAQTTALVAEKDRMVISHPHIINLQAWKDLIPAQKWPLDEFIAILGEN
jgi:hypothetical protein